MVSSKNVNVSRCLETSIESITGSSPSELIINLATVKNNSMYQSVMYIAYGLQKTRVLYKPFWHTRPLNFRFCLHIFYVYGRKAVQGAGGKTAPMIFSFLLK